MKRTIKAALTGMALAATLALAGCGDSDGKGAGVKSYIGFSGDCYKETPRANVDRCLRESTRH